MKKILIFLVLLIALLGCISPPTTPPDIPYEEEIVYVYVSDHSGNPLDKMVVELYAADPVNQARQTLEKTYGQEPIRAELTETGLAKFYEYPGEYLLKVSDPNDNYWSFSSYTTIQFGTENKFDIQLAKKDGQVAVCGNGLCEEGEYDYSCPEDCKESLPTPIPTPALPVGQPVRGEGKVVIEEFADFQCPFCKRFYDDVYQRLWDEYGDKITYVFRNFPLTFHENAFNAALAGECAHEQGVFWKYHDMLFENQEFLDLDSLKEYALVLQLDTEQFNSCLDSRKYEDEVNFEIDEGNGRGVSGTPTFFINGQLLVGAQPFDEFKKVIDEKLGSVIETSQVFETKEECDNATNCDCQFVMCDYIPEGKTFEEVCPNGSEYWQCFD